ncbi:hypothetical protein TNCT_613571 [Trichonephila clavata]|uniref:Uncharacterized protein n=1 Tax=Trichonephila clavata TaxID=2740835 RepID=A0A8X6GM85_TRICU|nr:hypothetical protein TNCT_613571 [Trichonephila clavata]
MINPIPFNIVINDLPSFLSPAVNSALFADDLIVWDSAVKKNQDSLSGTFNSALEKLAIWCREYFVLNRFLPPILSSRERFCISEILPPTTDVFLIPASPGENMQKKAEQRLYFKAFGSLALEIHRKDSTDYI